METKINEADVPFLEQVKRGMAGEEVVPAASNDRALGSAAGKIQYAEGWDSPMSVQELNEFLVE
jgi:hypothetical protein